MKVARLRLSSPQLQSTSSRYVHTRSSHRRFLTPKHRAGHQMHYSKHTTLPKVLTFNHVIFHHRTSFATPHLPPSDILAACCLPTSLPTAGPCDRKLSCPQSKRARKRFGEPEQARLAKSLQLLPGPLYSLSPSLFSTPAAPTSSPTLPREAQTRWPLAPPLLPS